MNNQPTKKPAVQKVNVSPYWHAYLKLKAGTKYKLQGLVEELILEDSKKPENKKFLPKPTN